MAEPERETPAPQELVEDAPAVVLPARAGDSAGLSAGLLDIVAARLVARGNEGVTSAIGEFLDGQLSPSAALRLWLGPSAEPAGGPSARPSDFQAWKKSAARRLNWQVAEIDRIIGEQLNEVLHHPRFQKLESSWRGLDMLVREGSGEGHPVVLRMLDVSWKDIQRDFEKANEFDQSELFRKIYEQEFGSPGGIPFSVLIGDYEIHPRPSAAHPFDDVAMLGNLAGIAAASFCPFVCGASPALFGVDSFLPLERSPNLAAGFQSATFLKWRSLRKQDDARFVGLVLPRILMREPWELRETTGFCFREDTSSPDISGFLWGNAAFAWGQVAIRSFIETGWLADIRGTDRNRDGGGLVTGLPSLSFATDREGLAIRGCTDLIVTDQQEIEFSRLGFLPLCQCHDSPFAAFYSSQSIQEAVSYDDAVASANAHISTMLQYMLCVSRFAHYLKVIARDTIGGATDPESMQERLRGWLMEYVTPDENARPEIKARRPLREADVQIHRDPGKPGSYQCSFSLLPHYQLDALSASIRLRTSLEGPG